MDNQYSLLRKEIKYIVSIQKAIVIKATLDRLLERDSYAEDGSYVVRSLYFDSMGNADFIDKLAGVSERKKVRIRTYNSNAALCKLEVKQKSGEWQRKRSFVIAETDARELAIGKYDVLKKYFSDFEASEKAYSVMQLGQYKPKVLIEYDRVAYQYPIYETRVTLDMNVRSSESELDIFSQNVNFVPILCGNAILEIKYSGKLMGFISNALERFGLTQSAYSKYCFGRRIYYDFNF